jgi:hypothetical protein
MLNKKAADFNELSGFNTFVNPDSKSNLPGDSKDTAVPYDTKGQAVKTRHRILPKRDEFNENAVRDFSNSIGTPSVVMPVNSEDGYKIPYRTLSTPGEMQDMSEFRDNIHQRRSVRIASEYLLRQAGYVVYFDRSPLQTGSAEQNGSSLPGDNNFQSTVTSWNSSTREQEKQPAEMVHGEILPGSGASSAKVAPWNAEYRNKTAKSYAEITKNLSKGVEERSKGLKVYKEEGDGSKQAYRVAFKPEYDGFTVEILTGDDKHPLQSKMLALKCNCPAWRFHGSEYWAKQEGYLLGKNKGTGDKPRMRDPKSRNKVCKHVVAVFKTLKKSKKK